MNLRRKLKKYLVDKWQACLFHCNLWIIISVGFVFKSPSWWHRRLFDLRPHITPSRFSGAGFVTFSYPPVINYLPLFSSLGGTAFPVMTTAYSASLIYVLSLTWPRQAAMLPLLNRVLQFFSRSEDRAGLSSVAAESFVTVQFYVLYGRSRSLSWPLR